MSDATDMTETAGAEGAVVDGGGAAPAPPVADPVDQVIARLELLSDEARNAVLERMDPSIAERIRLRMDSTPDRPHGQFSRDVVERRRMLREMSEQIHASNAARQAQIVEEQTAQAARPVQAVAPVATHTPTLAGTPVPASAATPAAPIMHEDPLDQLRVLHPAAIARAMQGERAEAWAIVLDRLAVHARGALQVYLEAPARAAIEEARARQSDLRATAPQLLETIEAAIARTVVPRAMREHHHLLSTTPPSWDTAAAGMEGSWQHA